MGPGRGLGTDSLPARPGLASEGASRGCRQEAARSESRGRGEVVGPREDALGLTLRVFVPLCLESPKASEGEGRKVGAGLPVTGGRGLIPGQSHPPGGGGGGVCVCGLSQGREHPWDARGKRGWQGCRLEDWVTGWGAAGQRPRSFGQVGGVCWQGVWWLHVPRTAVWEWEVSHLNTYYVVSSAVGSGDVCLCGADTVM